MSAKILIIEDDKALQRALSNRFEQEGFKILAATDGETAIRMVEELHPDLIILDIIIPKKNGFEVMEEVSKRPEISSIPVVVLSNLENTKDIEKMMSLGAKAYLVKANYSLDEVVEMARKFLKEDGDKKEK